MSNVVLPKAACDAIINMLQSAKDQTEALAVLTVSQEAAIAENPHEEHAAEEAFNLGDPKSILLNLNSAFHAELSSFCAANGVDVTVMIRALLIEGLQSARAYRMAARILELKEATRKPSRRRTK